jgi:two-component system sensor histidine kinase ChvG
VLVELYRIRSGLQKVLAVAILFTVGVTLWLAFSITRPLERLSKVATRIAKGETHLEIPVSGSGELRDLAAALRTMTERLRKRLLDTSAFAADVAHAFKSPLTSIRGASELLAQGAFEDPAARERFLRNIELDAERLDLLVTRLLQLSRIEASTESVQPLTLSTLLRDVADRSQTPDVDIAVRSPSAAWVAGRKEDLATAFANLFDNAVKFSPEGATVSVELEERADELRVLVRDDGPGIPKAVEARLFERFFTTDTEHGTGLGLSIVRSVVEAHGGKVTLQREPGRTGACFVVELRRTNAPSATETQGRSASSSSAMGGTITK